MMRNVLREHRVLLLVTTLLCLGVRRMDAIYVSGSVKQDSIPQASRALDEREVYNPAITNPHASSTWVIGSTVDVTWDVSRIPEGVTNPTGKVVLGYMDGGSDSDEHLDLQHPLAEGFNITEGHVSVVVPKASPADNYIVVLFGDSGNRSPTFTIA